MSDDTLLVRYGEIPSVGRFNFNSFGPVQRGSRVVVQSSRGLELGTVLEQVGSEINRSDADSNGKAETTSNVVRRATTDDENRYAELRSECEREFNSWQERLIGWNLDLELIDLEWTLDREKLVLYVLNERGPECTKLALYAAAAGLDSVEVQPVNADGLAQIQTEGGGCGSGGCGCHT